jgi:hypothetical protein
MFHTGALEQNVGAGTTYADRFRRTDAHRSEVVMMVFAMQVLSGKNLISQGVQSIQTVGTERATNFDLNMVLNSMFTFGTIAIWGCTRSCPCSARPLTYPQCSRGSACARSRRPAWDRCLSCFHHSRARLPR